jgi:hypothetical protein
MEQITHEASSYLLLSSEESPNRNFEGGDGSKLKLKSPPKNFREAG